MRLTTILAISALAAACTGSGSDGAPDQSSATVDVNTTAANSFAVIDTTGKELGMLEATERGGAIHVVGTLTGLEPGTKGMHLHAVGTCEPPFASAGPHWNPTGREHGADNPNGPHSGDLGNIQIAEDGSVKIDIMVSGASLSGENALLDADGASLVIHAGADDNKTDPAGNSGARIACGRIG